MEQVAVGESGETVVQRLMADFVDVLLETPRDPAQHGKEREVEGQQAELRARSRQARTPSRAAAATGAYDWYTSNAPRGYWPSKNVIGT